MTPTSYDEIYERFLSKIEDYSLLKEISTDIDYAKSLMLDYLKAAIPKFDYIDRERLRRDDVTQTFSVELTDKEQEILSTFMVVSYLSPKILRDEALEQRLGSKDYTTYSPAKLIEQIRALRVDFENEANNLMTMYYYTKDLD